MKKIISAAILFLMLALSACTSGEPINDKDTGEVIIGEKKYSYTEGAYIAYTPYYDGNGYAALLKLSVNAGVISEIHYDLFDKDLNRFSMKKSEETIEAVEAFKTEIKSLNSQAMQAQSAEGISLNGEYGETYLALLKQAVFNAAQGDTTPAQVDAESEYLTEYTSAYGLTSHLSVVYENEQIIGLNFYQSNSLGLKTETYPMQGDSESGLSYKECIDMLCTLPEDNLTLQKENPTGNFNSVIDSYNFLCGEIEKLRKPFEADYSQLFSNL